MKYFIGDTVIISTTEPNMVGQIIHIGSFEISVQWSFEKKHVMFSNYSIKYFEDSIKTKYFLIKNKDGNRVCKNAK